MTCPEFWNRFDRASLRAAVVCKILLTGVVLAVTITPLESLAQNGVPLSTPSIQVDRAEQEYRFIRGLVSDGLYPTALEQIRQFLTEHLTSKRVEEVSLLRAGTS